MELETQSYEESSSFPTATYYSDISFVADSYWGSDAYHRHLSRYSKVSQLLSRHSQVFIDNTTSTSSVVSCSLSSSSNFLIQQHPSSGVVIQNRWLVGDIVYIPASQWFESEMLSQYPLSMKMFIQAYIIKRTPKQVVLHLSAFNKDITRGFTFMEVIL